MKMASASLGTSRSTLPCRVEKPSSSKKKPIFSLNLIRCLRPSPPKRLSERDVRLEEIREVFRYFDKNGDGKISDVDLRSFLEAMGEDARDVQGGTALDFGEFVGIMNGGDEGHQEDLRRAFEMFEEEKGCGRITPKGLQRMLNRLGEPRSDQECERMILPFDLDGDGVLDFHEFSRMMSA